MRLNLGCGSQAEDGWINVDWLEIPGVDVVHNLLLFPYPFEDESANEIKAVDVLEHLPNYTPDNLATGVEFVKECHRILKPGGTLIIQVPHADSPNTWTDLTHVRGYTERSMNYFDDRTDLGRHYGYYSDVKFNVQCAVTRWIDPDTGKDYLGNCIFTMEKR